MCSLIHVTLNKSDIIYGEGKNLCPISPRSDLLALVQYNRDSPQSPHRILTFCPKKFAENSIYVPKSLQSQERETPKQLSVSTSFLGTTARSTEICSNIALSRQHYNTNYVDSHRLLYQTIYLQLPAVSVRHSPILTVYYITRFSFHITEAQTRTSKPRHIGPHVVHGKNTPNHGGHSCRVRSSRAVTTDPPDCNICLQIGQKRPSGALQSYINGDDSLSSLRYVPESEGVLLIFIPNLNSHFITKTVVTVSHSAKRTPIIIE